MVRWTGELLSRHTANVCLFAAVLSFPAGAQQALVYPVKSVRFMIGFGPGGSTDLMSRLLAQKLAERLGQPVVPELKTGATGTIAADAVAKAAPDGHTLIMITGAHPVVGVMMRKLPHDPVSDFAMISTVVSYPVVLTVSAASPYRTIEELLAAAKTAPNKVSFSSAGIGSGQHLIGEWIGVVAGLEFLHVPFRSSAVALTEMLTGRVDMMIDTMTNAYPHIRAGKTRALALTTRSGSPLLPGVPSISTLLPGIEFASWAGIVTTGGTPAAIVARLNDEIHAILRQPDIQKQLADLGGAANPSTPAEMRELIEREMIRWRNVIETRKIERQ
ncbi:MAG: Bug family tripartite tricarboxylate transporter substrate binding protein [Burkholderiales bacterium]